MKPWIILFTSLTALFSYSPAHAENVDVLKIHADYFPSREYAIGLDLDANHIINRIYFQTDRGNKIYYTLDQLNDFTPIFEVAGIKLVRIRIAQRTSTDSATIEMSYTTNYLTGTQKSLFFAAQYNSVSSKYDVTDARNQHVIHTAMVSTRYSLFVPIGIADVKTE